MTASNVKKNEEQNPEPLQVNLEQTQSKSESVKEALSPTKSKAGKKKSKKKEVTKTVELSDEQKARLRVCESAIRKGSKAFFAMCEAFQTIRKEELWKESHKSFPAYVKEKWHMDASKVSHYIKAAGVITDLKDCEKKPTNEGQCRVLGRLSTSDERREVWTKVLESEEKPTGRLIQKVAQEAGLLSKPDVEAEAPQKERNVLADIASTVNALAFVSENVGQIEPVDVDLLRQYVSQCRLQLDQIEQAISLKSPERAIAA
tara:strand:+ start:149 stop:928 length:780 start_codon:yes stop_codon:yes gene_type:complete